MQFQVNSFICELIHFMIPGWKAAVIKTDIRSWCWIMHGISPEQLRIVATYQWWWIRFPYHSM